MSSKCLTFFSFLVHMIYVQLIDSISPSSLKKPSNQLKASVINDVDIKDNKYDEAVEYIKYLLKDGISSASDTSSSSLSDFIGLSVDDVIVESIPGGITNHCYMVQLKNNPNKKIFVKHAAEELKAWSNVKLTSDRLRCEYQGMKTFAKYTPQAVPKVLYYDNEKKYLLNEFLDGYVLFKDLLIKGELDVDCARAMGTVMGRSHARTHDTIITTDQTARFLKEFANEDHFKLWQKSLFTPTFDILSNLQSATPAVEEAASKQLESTDTPSTSIDEVLNMYIAHTTSMSPSDKHIEQQQRTKELIGEFDSKGHVTDALKLLLHTYINKKQVI